MTRRTKPIKPDMIAWALVIEALPMDEIADIQREVRDEHTDNLRYAHISRAKLDVLKRVIFKKKNGGEIGVSDHAVLRYMERHKGIDVRAIRLELSALAATRKAADEQGHYEADGVRLVIPNGVVATVYPKTQEPPR